MLRYKQFRSPNGEPLDVVINQWLTTARPDVKFMQQSCAPTGDMAVSFLYEEGFHATEQRLTEEASSPAQQS